MAKTIKQVRCDHCDNLYESLWNEDKQALDCASFIKNDQLTCCYGSQYDMHLYKVKPNLFADLDPVCDRCIDIWLSKGYLELINTHTL